MLSWEEFEKECIKNNIYTIDNKSSKNIVFFGNCTIAPIGFFLNQLMNKNYNIHFIVSWLFEQKGFEKFNMRQVNISIQQLLRSADILVYHHHHKDYGIKASKIMNLCNKNTLKLIIPNLHFSFDAPSSELFHKSLSKLKTNIVCRSDFKEFVFISEYYKTIRFFNTSVHPTHYLLFLLAKSIKFKLFRESKVINIHSYYNEQNKIQYKNIKEFVCLPGFVPFTKEIHHITGIVENADYFDYYYEFI
jgi:hypothetical protein